MLHTVVPTILLGLADIENINWASLLHRTKNRYNPSLGGTKNPRILPLKLLAIFIGELASSTGRVYSVESVSH